MIHIHKAYLIGFVNRQTRVIERAGIFSEFPVSSTLGKDAPAQVVLGESVGHSYQEAADSLRQWLHDPWNEWILEIFYDR